MRVKLNRAYIRNLIDEPYFSRGEFYFNNGMVHIISVKDYCVKSKVVGSGVYRVTLRYGGEYLDGECSCPAFENWGLCKHMAATGFAMIQYNSHGYQSSSECSDRIDEQNRLEKALLKKQSRNLSKLLFASVTITQRLLVSWKMQKNSTLLHSLLFPFLLNLRRS